MLTQEYLPGLGWVTQDAAFRRYADPAASSADWWRLMQTPRYAAVQQSPDLISAFDAVASAGYATDPAYAAKLRGINPVTPAQRSFLDQREAELIGAGAPPLFAQLGARQAALESGWGRSAPGGNYYGIKAPAGVQVAQAGRTDVPQGLFAEIPTMAGQQAPQPMAPMLQPQAPGFWDRLAGSPAFNMGMGILASNQGNYGAWGPAVGRGAMLGMQNASAMQDGQQSAQMQQMKMQLAQRQWEKDQRDAQQVEEFIGTLPKQYQAMARMNPDGFAKFLMAQQAGPSPTDDMREYEAAQRQGFKGTFLDFQKEIKAAGATQIVMPGDKAEDKALAELGIEQYKGAQSTLETAQPKLGTIEVMGQLLDQINTGKLQPALADIKGWADAFGIAVPGIEKLAPAQAFNALANQMTLQARSTANGTGMPGAMSDADREFLRQMVPGLEKQKGTNRALLDIMRRLTLREQEIASIKLRYFDKYGTMRPTTDPTTGERLSVSEAVRRYVESRPIFSADYVQQVLGDM
jgi:hypothetical protein